jgi:geranylgeranyl pyrophosphate synthase
VVNELFATEAPSDDQVAAVVKIVHDAGGLDYARQRGEEYLSDAEAALADLPDSAAKDSLYSLMWYVIDRRS